jgi:acyl dehydratase
MNPELLAALDAQVGTPIKVFPWVTRASLDAIRHFALGLGDDNPLWWDDSFARASARGRMHAPPTFLYAAMSGGPWPEGEENEADRLLPTVVLWSGDRWVWHDPPWLDEPLRVDGEVVEISRREPRAAGGSRTGVGSVAKTELTRFRGEGGRPLAELYRRRIIFERDSPELSRPDLSAPAASYTEDVLRNIAAADRDEAERRRGPGSALLGGRRGGRSDRADRQGSADHLKPDRLGDGMRVSARADQPHRGEVSGSES